ncbi:molybdopterin-guanine dinucleotide biosynthesis protein B [Bacillus sp. V5-8f]|uniref:molybdopterin-guanine dinucleotide biosynthesis protein B n=1 Tax=Bacillus sp. V5-8f TaxID=2053044 RepID=UPI002154FF62|nr:molybdopterin-guanine dinucleotide biosynthesis protein B [Bacillus sp. V5-8f]
MVKPYIFQIVGYQNSGKTTIISKLTHQLNQAGLTVSVIKHHGHGGAPDLPDKDSTRLFTSGAQAALVEGAGTIQLTASLPAGCDLLSKNIDILATFNPDIILIEGYKRKTFPKAVVIRHESDLVLLEELENIQAVICWPEMKGPSKSKISGVPAFDVNLDGFSDWFFRKSR